jgi:hypothetical protein
VLSGRDRQQWQRCGDHHRFVNGERPHCELVTLLALIVGGWFLLGVLTVVVLNVAKWLVRSATTPEPRTAPSPGLWPAPHRSAQVSRSLPLPYAGRSVTARRSGIGPHPTG